VGAEEEHPDPLSSLCEGSVPVDGGLFSKSRMEGFACAHEHPLEPVQIQAVVDISPIGSASPFLDQGVLPKLAEMVGNEVLRLLEEADQLLHTPVAVSQSFEELPALLVGQELEESGKSCGRLHDESAYIDAI
jgi:hypothetical protein